MIVAPLEEEHEEHRVELELPPEPASPSVEELARSRHLWERFQRAEASGDPLASRRALSRLVRLEVITPEVVDARLRLAEDALSREDWSSARELVEALNADGQAGYRRHRVIALAYEGQASYLEAAQAWLEASKEATDAEKVRAAIEVAAHDQYLGGALAQARVTAESIGKSSEVLRQELEEKLDGETLVALEGLVEESDPDSAWLALLSARHYCAEGELKLCRKAAERALLSSRRENAESAQRILERVEAWDKVSPTKLGVLLPLSGPFQRHGQAALESLQQALKGAPHVELVVRDTAASVGKAASGAEELVLKEHVVAVLGPIGEVEGRAAVQSLSRFKVPHLVLSSHPQVNEGVISALRMRLSAGEKVKALARYAVTQLEVKNAALLVPEQQSRKRQMIAFWDEFVRLGGEIRSVVVYPSDERDFKPALGALLGSEKPKVGAVDFDALFIPEDALQVRRLVPFLKYFGVRTKTDPELRTSRRTAAVQLLGVEAWNSPTVIDPEGLTDNSVFVDTFFHDPDDAQVHAFVRGFYARHRRKPNAFQAEVFDAVQLVAQAMKGLERDDHGVREELLAKLLSTKHYRGVTGYMTVLEGGDLMIEPRVLTVDAQEIRLRLSEEEEAHMRRGARGAR